MYLRLRGLVFWVGEDPQHANQLVPSIPTIMLVTLRRGGSNEANEDVVIALSLLAVRCLALSSTTG